MVDCDMDAEPFDDESLACMKDLIVPRRFDSAIEY